MPVGSTVAVTNETQTQTRDEKKERLREAGRSQDDKRRVCHKTVCPNVV